MHGRIRADSREGRRGDKLTEKERSQNMAKDVITVNDREVVVREDTAKAFRGVRWMVASLAAFVLILILAGLAIFTPVFRRGVIETRPSTENSNVR